MWYGVGHGHQPQLDHCIGGSGGGWMSDGGGDKRVPIQAGHGGGGVLSSEGVGGQPHTTSGCGTLQHALAGGFGGGGSTGYDGGGGGGGYTGGHTNTVLSTDRQAYNPEGGSSYTSSSVTLVDGNTFNDADGFVDFVWMRHAV